MGEYFADTYDELSLQAEPLRGLKSEKRHNSSSIPTKPNLKGGGPKLPQRVIDRVKTFVFFLGYPHSGHSIVGSLMDSHPHMVVSNEADIFTKLSKGVIAPTKTAIFNAIWENTVQSITHGGVRAASSKGYNLTIGNSYEGKYVDHINVIGDKKGGTTVYLLMKQPRKFSDVFNVIKTLNVTLKVILVHRNPYDIVASTFLLARYSEEEFASIKKANIPNNISSSPGHDQINDWIGSFFSYLKAIVNAKKTYSLDMIEIHGKDLISDPKGTLLKLCNNLGVTCSNKYLEICTNNIFKTESRTRRLIKWTDGNLKTMKENIGKYSSLKDYSFDSL